MKENKNLEKKEIILWFHKNNKHQGYHKNLIHRMNNKSHHLKI
jgi:spore germination protein GerM